jgi:hypothetical protein
MGLLALALVAFVVSPPALAQSGLGELTQRLRESGDFRVRTQAALALGASRDKQAVPALCGALADANTTVRAAAAAGLGRLALGGTDCLRSRLGAELSQDVLAVIRRALERLEVPQKPAITSSTRYYLAIGQPTNETTRATAALDQAIRKALTKQLSSFVGIVIAPADETPAQAKALLDKHPHVKAVFVWPKVRALYGGGALKLSIDLSLFTYPGKAFKGSMSRSLTMPDTLPGDVSSEDQLIEMAAERMAPDLEKTAARL